MPRIAKDCFGTVISTLSKMRECVRCELLAECRSINWTVPENDAPPAVARRQPPVAEAGDDPAFAGGSGAGPGN